MDAGVEPTWTYLPRVPEVNVQLYPVPKFKIGIVPDSLSRNIARPSGESHTPPWIFTTLASGNV